MVVERGEVWWITLPEPAGSEPGFRRPFVIVQSNVFNRSRLQTVIGVLLTSNMRLLDAPGNVLVPGRAAGLPRDSVANVTQLITVDRDDLHDRTRKLPGHILADIDVGLRLVLDLQA